MFRQLLAALLLLAVANAGKGTDTKAILENLLKNVSAITDVRSPGSSDIQSELHSLALAIKPLTLSDYIVITDKVSSLGLFAKPGKGVYVGIKWTPWNVGVPQGGRFTADQGLGASLGLSEVVGVKVDGLVPRRTLVVATKIETNKNPEEKALFYDHRRIVDVVFYDAEGEDEGVQLFWEPASDVRRLTHCLTWVPTGGWDSGRCKTATFRAGLVGCRCKAGATFGDGHLRRASFMLVEESEQFYVRKNLKYFERMSSHLQNQNIFGEDLLKEVRVVVHELVKIKPDLLFTHSSGTKAVISDVSNAIFRTDPPNKRFVMDISSEMTLAVVEGDVGAPLAGLYVGKRWPTDNPQDSAFYAAGLRPGGSLLEDTSDTEVFAVRIRGNGSLPRRASLLLTNWNKEIFQRDYPYARSTQRVGDLVFSGDHKDLEGHGVEVTFETQSKDLVPIRCRVWDFHKSVWGVNSCSSQNITSRLNLCRCPKALFKVDERYRTRILMTEETNDHTSFTEWDIFNRTTHYLGSLANISLPSDQLSNVTALFYTKVLLQSRANNFVFPLRLLDHLPAILHRLALDPNNPTAYSCQQSSDVAEDRGTTAAMFVQDDVNSLGTVAITDKNGRVMSSTENSGTNVIVAVNFNPPQNGVGRVALTYNAIRSRGSDRQSQYSFQETRMVDVSWSQTTPSSGSRKVVLRLKPFVDAIKSDKVSYKTCRYWDFGHQSWSEGCTIRLDSGKELCQCTIPTTDGVIGHLRFQIASDWSEKPTYENR